jgi:hypothetical protein
LSNQGDRHAADVFKHAGDIRIASLAYNANGTVGVTAWRALTNNLWTTEESMPYFTPSGKYVLYTCPVQKIRYRMRCR